MTEATRRQILADMGIDVWRLRGAARRPAERPAASGRPPEPAVPLVSTHSAIEPAPAHAPSPPAAKPTPVSATATPRAPPRVRHQIVSLAAAGVLLLLDEALSRRDARLARDVLAAAGGDWQAKPVSRRFDWPPPVGGDVLPDDPEAFARALAAFVAKDVSDHQVGVVVLTRTLAERLPDTGVPRRVVIPALAELARDADAKRSLWRDLEAGPR